MDLSRLSVAKIRQLLDSADDPGAEEILRIAKDDSRRGVRELVVRYHNKKKRDKLKLVHLNMTTRLERRLFEKGYKLVAGVDEVGRGCLAGPIVAAAVIMPRENSLYDIKDSKVLSAKKREYLAGKIREIAICYKVAVIASVVIDKYGIQTANLGALKAASLALEPAPDFLLVDGFVLKDIGIPHARVIKGDQNSQSIAAASIIAKVYRDELMRTIHEKYPVYDFKKNKGYGTADHIEAIEIHGPSEQHRRTFSPVSDYFD